mgnify:CR=1 FL=1
MDCPVCQYKGIPESTNKCPNCHSDLTGFRQIYHLRDTIKQKRNTIIGLSALLVIIIVVLAYLLLFSDGLSSRYSRMAVQEKEQEIVRLQKQNSQLQKRILDLQDRLNMNKVSDSGFENQRGKDFEKVIPSPTADDRQSSGSQTQTSRRAASAESQQQSSSGQSARQTSSQQDKPEVTYYTVKAGETLYSIAKREYGDGKKYKKIMRDNNIQDPSNVKVGMKLKIIK